MHPAILFTGFFFFAVAYNLLGPLATNIMSSTGLSLSQSGSLVSFQQIGALLSMATSLFLMKKIRQSTVAKIGYIVLMIALIAIAITNGSFMLFAGYLVLGFGSFLIDSGSNASLAGDYYEKRSLYVPLLHFCYSAGAIATGYLILPFKGPSWPWAYGSVGIVLALVLSAGLIDRKRRTVQAGQTSNRDQVQADPVMPIVKDKAFILYTVVIMLYMGSQVVCAAWIPVYVETELGQPATITATSLTVFWVGTAISRLIIGPMLQKGHNPFTLSIIGMFLSAASLAGATLVGNIVGVLILVMFCGFFAGATIPLYIVVTSTWYPKNTAFISLSYIFGGTVGRMIFPWLVTVVAVGSSLGFALLASSSMLFVSSLLVFLVKRLTSDRASA